MITLVLVIYLTCLQRNLRLDESSQSSNKPKEVGQDEVIEILDEPK